MQPAIVAVLVLGLLAFTLWWLRSKGLAHFALKLPHAAVLPVAYAAEAWASMTGVAPNVTVDGVKLARHRMYFSSRRAETELGYRAGPAREALADAIQWFEHNGYLR